MQKPLQSKIGMILMEALVAMATLTAGVIILSTIINNAFTTLAVSKDYLTAQNLVTEAIEALKTVRDSNWLIVPSNKQCWLTLDPATNLVDINALNCANPFSRFGNYIPVFSNNHWKIVNQGLGALALSPQNAELAAQNNFRVYREQSGSITTYEQGVVTNTKSKFYRSIVYLQSIANQANFEVKVQWLDGSKVRTIKRRTTLYNYL